jgi:hypothetical protein
VHDDERGYPAALKWKGQLQNIALKVDRYAFDGWRQSDGEPVKDLNDLLRVDVDDWEQDRRTIESIMDFGMEGRN